MSIFCDYFGFLLVNYCAIAIQQPTFSQSTNPVRRSSTSFSVEYQWRYLNYTWPSYADYAYAIQNGYYIPENNALTGIKIYKNNIYVSLPRMNPGIPVTLGYFPKNKTGDDILIAPFPDWIINVQSPNCNNLQSVQSLEIDTNGIMWVLDGVRNNNESTCPAKLVFLDLNQNGKLVDVYTFPDHIALSRGGFLNDLVIDETDGTYAYVTDASNIDPGLVIYSREKNTSWKIRDPSMFPDFTAVKFSIGTYQFSNPSAINGIALSQKSKGKKLLYYCPLSAFKLYSISTDILKNFTALNDPNWRRNVSIVGTKQSQSGGIIMDSYGNLFYTLLPLYGVGKWNTNQSISTSEIIDSNKSAIQWPDSFSFDDTGYLYLLASNIYKYMNRSANISEINIRILKYYTNSRSYLY